MIRMVCWDQNSRDSLILVGWAGQVVVDGMRLPHLLSRVSGWGLVVAGTGDPFHSLLT